MDSDIITKKDLKDLTIDDYKYFSRRYEIVSMAFIGFCVYGNVEILKWLLASKIHYEFLYVTLYISFGILIILLFISWLSIQMETRIREDYMIFFDKEEKVEYKNKADIRSQKFERKLKKIRLAVFFFTFIAVGLSFFVTVKAIYLIT